VILRRLTILGSVFALVCAALPVTAVAAALWKVVSVEERMMVDATLEITAGKISGTGGCNTYSAPAKFVRGMTEIGPIVATEMACDKLESEQAFFSALERSRAFRVEGANMTLFDEDGKPLILLSR
jgi:heat shock protein HslJ